jgi:hypothetical protein
MDSEGGAECAESQSRLDEGWSTGQGHGVKGTIPDLINESHTCISFITSYVS